MRAATAWRTLWTTDVDKNSLVSAIVEDGAAMVIVLNNTNEITDEGDRSAVRLVISATPLTSLIPPTTTPARP